MVKANNKYTKMQHEFYEKEAATWSPENRDPVVGSFDAHNAWEGYENLFNDVPDLSKCRVLDFGCGPGRNIVKYWDRVKEIDGVDLSAQNLFNAKAWIDYNKLTNKGYTLYLCNGVDLSVIPSNIYDLIVSTITFQHICVHDIRFSYLEEFFRILKPGGIVSVQQGFGNQHHDYFENAYEAPSTNMAGADDAGINSVEQIQEDLEKVGFVDFHHYLDDPGPGDGGWKWIYWNARKA